jgi:lipoate-protein ligase B
MQSSEDLPYPVLHINRGGKATYHGPGQLVGYAILDLRAREQGLHRHLRLLEAGLIELALRFGVAAGAREGLTVVWCGPKKLASIGVGVRRWITMHGFAINVCGALDGFNFITPCGLEGVEITSLEREGATGPDVATVADMAAGIFARNALTRLRAGNSDKKTARKKISRAVSRLLRLFSFLEQEPGLALQALLCRAPDRRLSSPYGTRYFRKNRVDIRQRR